MDKTNETVDAGVLKEIASALTVMMMSAKCFVDSADDGAVIGYRIKTGAIHKVIGILACAGHPVSIPSNMPLADDDREFTNAAEWAAHYLPNDFVLGDNTRRIAEVVTPESVRKALRLDEIAAAPPPASTNRLTDEQTPIDFNNRLTPYGMLVRALRIVAGTTLYDMAKHLSCGPAELSAIEFGRKPVTNEMLSETASYFSGLDVHNTLQALRTAREAT